MPRIGLSNFFLRDAELVDRELVIARSLVEIDYSRLRRQTHGWI